MKRKNTKFNVLKVLVAGCFMFATLSSVAAVKLSNAEISSLAKGDTVRQPLRESTKSGFYGGTGWVMIDAPPQKVWEAIVSFNSYPSYWKYTSSAKEIARKGNKSLVKMSIGYKMITVSYHLDVVKDRENWTLSYKLNKNRPHDIESARGYWRLLPQKGGKTLVAYVASISIPSGIDNFLTDKKKKAMERYVLGAPSQIKKHLEKNKRRIVRNVLKSQLASR